MIFFFFDTTSLLRPFKGWGGVEGLKMARSSKEVASVAWRVLVGELNWEVPSLNHEKTMKRVSET